MSRNSTHDVAFLQHTGRRYAILIRCGLGSVGGMPHASYNSLDTATKIAWHCLVARLDALLARFFNPSNKFALDDLVRRPRDMQQRVVRFAEAWKVLEEVGQRVAHSESVRRRRKKREKGTGRGRKTSTAGLPRTFRSGKIPC